jgi:integrase
MAKLAFSSLPPGKYRVERCLGFLVTPAGHRSFFFSYCFHGKDRRKTIGPYPDWNLSQARVRKGELRRMVDSGIDPLAEEQADRDAPTMRDLAKRYIKEALPARRASTALEYRRQIMVEILPVLGDRKVAAVTFADVARLHRKITERGVSYIANRTVALLSAMFAKAIRWEWIDRNPARGIERNPEDKRRRYLSAPELSALLSALEVHPDRQAANVIRLLLLTGCRSGEALGARWDQFDLGAGIWAKTASDTKQRRDHQTPLSGEALDLLAEIRAESTSSSPFVFLGRGAGHRVDVKLAWAAICRSAGIEGLRMHDLRHSFASFCVNSGVSLQVVSGLLGHSNIATSARYAHLADSTLRTATNQVGRIIAEAGKPKLKVVK